MCPCHAQSSYFFKSSWNILENPPLPQNINKGFLSHCSPLQQLEVNEAMGQIKKSGKILREDQKVHPILVQWCPNEFLALRQELVSKKLIWKLHWITKALGKWCHQFSLYDKAIKLPESIALFVIDTIKLHSVLKIRKKSTLCFTVKPTFRHIQLRLIAK